MSSPSSDSLKTELDENKLQIGKTVKASTGLPTDASQLLYVDSSMTTSGFIRISLIDSAGNITDGDYYMPYGTLA